MCMPQPSLRRVFGGFISAHRRTVPATHVNMSVQSIVNSSDNTEEHLQPHSKCWARVANGNVATLHSYRKHVLWQRPSLWQFMWLHSVQLLLQFTPCISSISPMLMALLTRHTTQCAIDNHTKHMWPTQEYYLYSACSPRNSSLTCKYFANMTKVDQSTSAKVITRGFIIPSLTVRHWKELVTQKARASAKHQAHLSLHGKHTCISVEYYKYLF